MNDEEREAIIEAFVNVKRALNSIRHFIGIQKPEGINVRPYEHELTMLFAKLRRRVLDEMELQINDFDGLHSQLNYLIANGDAGAAFYLLREETLLNPHGCQVWVDEMITTWRFARIRAIPKGESHD